MSYFTTLRSRPAGQAHRPLLAARRLVLIDIENIAGQARLRAPNVAEAMARLASGIDLTTHDDLVIAADIGNAVEAFFEAPPCARRLMGTGPDGADLQLLEVLLTERIAGRYDTVVIASGDGIFADIAVDLRAQGLTVISASLMRSTSIRLRLAVDNTVYLDGSDVMTRMQEQARSGAPSAAA